MGEVEEEGGGEMEAVEVVVAVEDEEEVEEDEEGVEGEADGEEPCLEILSLYPHPSHQKRIVRSCI